MAHLASGGITEPGSRLRGGVGRGGPPTPNAAQPPLPGGGVGPPLAGPGTRLASRRTVLGRDCLVRQYRPRVGTGHSRVERWTNRADATDDSWRVISPTNTTIWYGRDAQSRISGPVRPRTDRGLDHR